MSLSRLSRLSKSTLFSYTSLLPLGNVHTPLLSTLMYANISSFSTTTPTLGSASSSSSTSITIAKQAANGETRINVAPYSLKALAGYINGQWVNAQSGKTIAVYNPADRECLGYVPDMNRTDTLLAIQAAKDAFPAWANKNSFERSAILRRIVTLMLANIDQLAILLTAETGKPFEEAKGEIKYSADFFEWYAEEAKRSYGEVLPPARNDRRMMTIQQPVGPVALLTPWNFPAAMPARKIAPALAAGCTIVLRPSINTPFSAIAMAQIMEEAGVPPGVFNLIMGEDHTETASILCASPDIKKLSFTGSTPVGKLLMQQCSTTVKRLSLELGGRAPFIVFDDADVDAAVEGAIQSKFRNAGQTCVCANTLFVQDKIYEEFVNKLTTKVSALKIGDGLLPNMHVGPVIHEKALKACDNFVQEAVQHGARIRTGGKISSINNSKGYFYEPTVLENVKPDMSCVTQEIFAPLAPVVKFSSEKEVIDIANKSTVGLAAYFFTKDTARTWRVSEALQVGMVGINTGLISTANAPFGGIKESGFGREGARHGLAEYMNLKYIMHAV